MTRKELSQLYYLNNEIEYIKQKILEIETRAEKTTSTISDMPKGGSSGDKVSNNVMDLIFEKKKLEKLENQYDQAREKIYKFIETLPNGYIKRIFLYRFINNYTWDKVSIEIGGNATEDSVKQLAYRYMKNLK